jgi:hypothetical protein
MTHIDDGTLVQLRDGGGALMPAAVLEADDHLTSCEACRARLAAAIATECAEDARALMPFATEVEAYRSGRPRAVLRFAAGLAVDAARARGLSASAAAAAAEEARRTTPGDHLLIGALEEQAGHRERALEEYRALLAEHPGSAVAARLVARVSGHP